MKSLRPWLFALSVVLLVSCATRPPQDLHDHKEMIQRYFDRWANHGDTAVADELMASDLVLSNPPAVLRSLAEYKASMSKFHAAFPDLRFTVDELVAERDLVVARWTLRATQQGDYAGHDASGKSMTIGGVSTFRISGGKIGDIHVSMDRLGMQHQLGWLPAPAPAPSK